MGNLARTRMLMINRMLRDPLPDDVVWRPQRLADLTSAGVTRREREGPLWRRLAKGVHGWCELDPTDPDVRIATAVAAQPAHAVLGGWASLRVQGLTVLDGRTGPSATKLQPLLVHVGPGGRTRPTPRLDVDRGILEPDDVLVISGLQVICATAACISIARRYGAEEGLVAADASVAAGLTSSTRLRRGVAGLGRRRGVRAARLMAELVDGRSASPPESRLRYVWVVEAGLPIPEVNVTVLSAIGFFAGKPDLLDPESATVAEYDGAQHRELGQHTADNVREEGFERLGLIVTRATAIDLWPGRKQLVARLREAHRRGSGRDRSCDGWTWHP